MAAVKEISNEEKLRALYELQKVDSKIDEIHILKGELPMEVADLEDEIAGLETRLLNISNEIKELDDKVSGITVSKKESNTLIKKYDKQQGNVKNNREYDALTKEIELQNLEIQLAEKKVKEAKISIDSKNEYLTESKKLLKDKKAQLKEKKVELEKIITETDKEVKTLERKSAAAKKKIEERLIIAYEKIKSTYKNGLAVVPVERAACGGCFNKVPPQKIAEIRYAKKIDVCEHCGRILVDPEL